MGNGSATTLFFFAATPTPKLQTPRKLVSCCLSSAPLRVAFAGGNTGSHVYPSVGIAEELKAANPACEFLFIGTAANAVEAGAVSSAGYNFVSVPPPPHSLGILLFPQRFLVSLLHCLRHLRQFQPQVVVGTGGHVSLPVCLAAKLRGVDLLAIHEPNSVPGFVNKLLSFFADVIFVAFNSTVDSFPRHKCVVSGNPVRFSLRNIHNLSKVSATCHFFPGYSAEKKKKVLLVLGGSFGANAVNIAMLNLYYELLREDSDLYIIWQTGVEAFDEMDSLVRTHPRLFLTPFMYCMDMAYAAADLIVSRAGAMTCYEILATGKPSILIPSPNFSEGNQFRNASLMADLAGVTVITEDELDSSTLAIAIQQILRDEKKMEDMSERALKAANPNASAEIAKHILSLVKISTKKKRNGHKVES